MSVKEHVCAEAADVLTWGLCVPLPCNPGLTNPIGKYKGQLMGNCGELCSQKYGITRLEQDTFAANSYARSNAAREGGKFEGEIVAVHVPSRRGMSAHTLTADEESVARGAMSLEALGKMPTAFDRYNHCSGNPAQ